WEYIAEAAKNAGLDVERLKMDYTNGEAEKRFQQDLADARELGVRGLPSIYFIDANGKQEFVYGSKPYNSYEQAIQTLLPNAEKKQYAKSMENLFSHYNSLTVKELAVLSEVDFETAKLQLESMVQQEKLKKTVTKNGNLYAI